MEQQGNDTLSRQGHHTGSGGVDKGVLKTCGKGGDNFQVIHRQFRVKRGGWEVFHEYLTGSTQYMRIYPQFSA